MADFLALVPKSSPLAMRALPPIPKESDLVEQSPTDQDIAAVDSRDSATPTTGHTQHASDELWTLPSPPTPPSF